MLTEILNGPKYLGKLTSRLHNCMSFRTLLEEKMQCMAERGANFAHQKIMLISF